MNKFRAGRGLTDVLLKDIGDMIYIYISHLFSKTFIHGNCFFYAQQKYTG